MSDKIELDFDKVDELVDAFGGVRPMATALGVPASTVSYTHLTLPTTSRV